ncbi:MAG TPA: 2-phospho-L-lactate transferase [Polyangiaceae bacterium]|jgi:LPPG:FO 2-phospho-L-lactate transferase
MNIVALAGGTGAAKFLRGLCQVASPADLTIIGNTGDDLELFGLSISPDLDTVGYTLSDRIDTEKGWGVAGDTFHLRAALEDLGEKTYFALGDKDLAVHVLRTERLRRGVPLSRVTAELGSLWGLQSRLLPMSDEPVRTRVRTPSGWLAFQEFFVRERYQPEVVEISYDGAEDARPAPGVLEAIRAADAILICPSNPISSVGPILAVPGIREALAARRSAVTAVSPVIGESPVSGPAGKMMRARGYPVTVLGVADVYHGLLSRLFIDPRDAGRASALRELGIEPTITDIMMPDREREVVLARAVLGAAT